MNAGGICGHVVLNERKVAALRCSNNVGFACNAGGGSLPSGVSDVRRGACSTARCIPHPNTQHGSATRTFMAWTAACMADTCNTSKRVSHGRVRGEKHRTSISPWAASTAAGAAGIACSNVKCQYRSNHKHTNAHKRTCSIATHASRNAAFSNAKTCSGSDVLNIPMANRRPSWSSMALMRQCSSIITTFPLVSLRCLARRTAVSLDPANAQQLSCFAMKWFPHVMKRAVAS